MIDLKAKPFYLTDEQVEWVNATRQSLTTEQKIAQLFVLMGAVNTPMEELRHRIGEQGIGGLLLRPAPKEQIKAIFDELDTVAKIPYLKAANLEEGGAGILSDGTYFGSQEQVAAANDPAIVEKFAQVCAAEGRSVGVNWTYSPVCDIDINFRNPITNVRTFGSNAEVVRRSAVEYVKACQAMGVAASCKHYPGDGVDYRDQHLHPTYNTLSAQEWYDTYGSIYKACIDAGLMSVMVGHIVQPNVIRDINPAATEADLLPGSQSRELITGVLREKYGFNGLIITDATIMGGYIMTMPRRQALPKTLNAGIDMFCFTTDIDADLRILQQAVEAGEVTMERLDEAVTRVLALKAAVPNAPQEIQVPGAQWAAECADKAVTLVKDTQHLVPATTSRFPKVKLTLVGNDNCSDGSITAIAKEVLERLGYETTVYVPSFKDDMMDSTNLPQDVLNLVLIHLPHASNQVTVRPTWFKKHAVDKPTYITEETYAVISLANPYVLQDVPRVRTYINTYSATRDTITAALEKLAGRSEFVGVSPVDAFCGLYDTRL